MARRAFDMDSAVIDAGRPQAARMNSMLTKVHGLASAGGLPTVLEQATGLFVAEEERGRMHAFEASLFMIGYNVACLQYRARSSA